MPERPRIVAAQDVIGDAEDIEAGRSAPLRIYDRAGVWVATLRARADLNEENILHDIRTALAAGDQTAG